MCELPDRGCQAFRHLQQAAGQLWQLHCLACKASTAAALPCLRTMHTNHDVCLLRCGHARSQTGHLSLHTGWATGAFCNHGLSASQHACI